LRFRAPREFNEVIRQGSHKARRHAGRRAGCIRRRHADGIIGDTLMLEHLHPNAGGYLLLAQSFHAALVAAEIPAGGTPLGDAVAVRDAPLTEIERLAGEYRVARLKADWPFHERRQPFSLPAPANEPERIARDWFEGRIDWLAAMNRALAHYQQAGDYDEAARIAVNLATAFPFRADAQYIAGSASAAERRSAACPALPRCCRPQGTREYPSSHVAGAGLAHARAKCRIPAGPGARPGDRSRASYGGGIHRAPARAPGAALRPDPTGRS
jgi:hypothetical protein